MQHAPCNMRTGSMRNWVRLQTCCKPGLVCKYAAKKKQASKRSPKQTSHQACKQATKKASRQVINQQNKPQSMQASIS
eukprot:361399-Chlamydomonas_euryale.AAC.14